MAIIQDKTIMNLVAKYCSAFFKDFSVVGQNCQKAHFPCPPPLPPKTVESLANTRATATTTWSSTIALILKDKRECKLHGLKRCAMPQLLKLVRDLHHFHGA